MRPPSLLLAFAAATLLIAARLICPPSAHPQTSASKSQVDEDGWVGTYTFQEGGGRTAGSTFMSAEHTLAVYRRGRGLTADLDADGYQTAPGVPTRRRSSPARRPGVYFRKVG